MRGTPVCAIDSRPLNRSIFETFDYSGLQVWMPTHVSLKHASTESSVNANGTRVDFVLNPLNRWSGGTPVCGPDFARGILEVRKRNPFIGNFLLRKLIEIKTTERSVSVLFKGSQFRATECFSIPNFVPFRPGNYSSGSYSAHRENEEFHYERNKDGQSPIERFVVKEIQSPEENLKRYLEGTLDVTADTAFPFYRWSEFSQHADLVTRPTGLEAMLLFEGDLANENALDMRRCLSEKISHADFSGILPNICPVRLKKQRTELPIPKGYAHKLRIAYDDFFPNREICEEIANQLQMKGWHVELEKDNYYQHGKKCDLRFSILRHLAPGDYLRYASLIFNSVVKKSPSVRQAMFLEIQKVERTNNTLELDACGKRLERLVAEVIPTIPLFGVTSCYLSRLPNRMNPLLSSFVEDFHL